MRVILDTNVLIAAFITHGVCSDLLEHCFRNHHVVISEFILSEFHEHLVRKFHFSSAEALEAIALLRLKTESVRPAELDKPVCRDSDDDTILGTAVAGQVVCIITGDRDLRVLKRYGSIDIISPGEFAAYEAARH